MAEQMRPEASAPTLSMSFCLRLENSYIIDWMIYICVAYLLLSRTFSISFVAVVVKAIASRLPSSNPPFRHRVRPPQPQEPRHQHPPTQTVAPLILVLHNGTLKHIVTEASSFTHPDVAVEREPARERGTRSQERAGQDRIAARAPQTTTGLGSSCGCRCDARRVTVQDDRDVLQVAGPADDEGEEREEEPVGDDAPGTTPLPVEQGGQQRSSVQIEVVSNVVVGGDYELGRILPGIQPVIVGQLFVDGMLSLDG